MQVTVVIQFKADIDGQKVLVSDVPMLVKNREEDALPQTGTSLAAAPSELADVRVFCVDDIQVIQNVVSWCEVLVPGRDGDLFVVNELNVPHSVCLNESGRSWMERVCIEANAQGWECVSPGVEITLPGEVVIKTDSGA